MHITRSNRYGDRALHREEVKVWFRRGSAAGRLVVADRDRIRCTRRTR